VGVVNPYVKVVLLIVQIGTRGTWNRVAWQEIDLNGMAVALTSSVRMANPILPNQIVMTVTMNVRGKKKRATGIGPWRSRLKRKE
jgi:hypothetical protein